MSSTLRRSTRSTRHLDATTASPPATSATLASSPTPSPSKLERKRKRSLVWDEHPSSEAIKLNGAEPGNPLDQQSSSNSDINGTTVGQSQPASSETNAAPSSSRVKVADEYKALLGIKPDSDPSSNSDPSLPHDQQYNDSLELVLLQQDAVKLTAVIQTLAPEILEAQISPPLSSNDIKGKSPEPLSLNLPFTSLNQALIQATKLRDLRHHILALRQPILKNFDIQSQFASQLWPNSDSNEIQADQAKLCVLTLILNLIDQLAIGYRESIEQGDAAKGQVLASLIEKRAEALEEQNKRLKLAQAGVQLEQPSDWNDNPHHQSASRYALHMRLPRGDYFSKAVDIDQQALKTLDPGQADLVAIAPDSKSRFRNHDRDATVPPPPTLGQRMAKSVQSRLQRISQDDKKKPIPAVRPVTFLSYGNYASFAPCYDSATASLSYTASRKLWFANARARAAELLAWGPHADADLLEESEYEDDQPDPVEAPSPPESLPNSGQPDLQLKSQPASIDLNNIDESLDADLIRSGLEHLEREQEISAQLRFNMRLLAQLQDYQWARLRKSFLPPSGGVDPTRKPQRSKNHPVEPEPAAEEIPPSQDEMAIASTLLDSLSSLLVLQPRLVDPFKGGIINALPDSDNIKTFSQTMGAIDPELAGRSSSGYWGTLDENLFGPVSNQTKQVAPHLAPNTTTPKVIRDKMTVRLTEESESQANTVIRSGALLGAGRDSGKGMLERFASSRTYNSEEDKHDIEPLAQPDPRSPEKQPANLSPVRPGTVPAHGPLASTQVRPSLPPYPMAGGAPANSQRYPPQPTAAYPNGTPIRRPPQPGSQPADASYPPSRPGYRGNTSAGNYGGPGTNASYAFASSPARPPAVPYGYSASPQMHAGRPIHPHPLPTNQASPMSHPHPNQPQFSPGKQFVHPTPSHPGIDQPWAIQKPSQQQQQQQQQHPPPPPLHARQFQVPPPSTGGTATYFAGNHPSVMLGNPMSPPYATATPGTPQNVSYTGLPPATPPSVPFPTYPVQNR